MFASRFWMALLLAFALVVVALSIPRHSDGAGPHVRYVVKPGDTLWEIADARLDGDPREGVWWITERNGLSSPTLQPGQVLYIPR
jgi:hypothetical protein